MPSIDENRKVWGEDYDWSQEGDEWSGAWGGSDYVWSTTIHPRIQWFLPAEHILEIAPGFGRVTRFLKDQCRRLSVVDLSERCITACRERFAASDNIEYHCNDGRSLEFLQDASVDFIFSWDSLVHAEADTIAAYVQESARVLKPVGFGFLHHSNLAEASHTANDARDPDWRAKSMSATRFRELCAAAGLSCPVQEIISWEGRPRMDCFSLFTPRTDLGEQQVLNENFFLEAHVANLVSKLRSSLCQRYDVVSGRQPEGSQGATGTTRI